MVRKLSVMILTFNNEDQIEKCIRSVEDIAGEIIVLDANSTDFTARMSGYLGANVIPEGRNGSDDLLYKGVKVTTYDWILLLHGNEEVFADLKRSIIAAISYSLGPTTFNIRRENYYCGKKIKYGSWKPSIDARLTHRSLLNDGQSFRSKKNEREFQLVEGILQVDTFASIEHHRYYIDQKTRLRSKQLICYQQNVNIKLMLEPAWRFVKSYIGKLGFLDGLAGYRLSKMLYYEHLTSLRSIKQQHEEIARSI
jgi:hypothetical protein